jgi:hypothetical protein
MGDLVKASIVQLLIGLLFLSFSAPGQTNTSKATAVSTQAGEASLLKADEVAGIMPATVFFQGKAASIQGRNSGGVRFGDKSLMLVSLVDTSGYSSQVQEKYQAYLITETPIDIDGHRLAPGAYGCGFINTNSFVVMDIGGHDLFTAHSNRDDNLRRPTPLQVVAAPEAGKYRLYAGRNYVVFQLATGK